VKFTLATALLVLAASPALAQTVIYSDDFEGRRPAWQSHGLWAADETPNTVPGGQAYSGTRSQNYNNGTNYAGVSRGSCASPSIQIPAGADATLSLRCNYQTETTGLDWDKRSVLWKLDGTVVEEVQLASARGRDPRARCGAMGTWHTHEFTIPAAQASRQLVIELVFNSVDDYANDFAGWFVDDVEVRATTAPSSAAFDRISRNTRDFRQVSTTLELDARGVARVLRSSPTARYAPVNGQATPAELRAVEDAVRRGSLATIPSVIPDNNVYIVAPTSFLLVVDSAAPGNQATIGGSLGVYDQWAPQLQPVMSALRAIEQRLLGGTNPPPPGDDHGDTMSAATTLNLDPIAPATDGKIDPAGDVDYFQVAEIVPMIAIFPPPQSTYTIETTVQGSMDTVLELYDVNGVLLTTNDDGGQGLASRVTHTATRGSVLYAKVRHYSSSGVGSYSIRASSTPVTLPPVGVDDHGDTPQTATTLEVNGPAASGAIDAGDADYFQLLQIVPAIFPPPTFTYVIQTSVVGNMDTVIEVYGADGTTLLASNDDAPGLGLASRVEITAAAGSVRYVKVRHYSTTGAGSYSLSVSTQP
jgi:hypothetical protein